MRKYAIIKTGGKQYRVGPGDVVRVEKLSAEEDDVVEFDRVLLTRSGDEVRLGKPFLDNAKVTARVLAQDRADKITVFKYKPSNNYRRKRGHRQPFTEVEIEDIQVSGA